jgi:hypothetical protein
MDTGVMIVSASEEQKILDLRLSIFDFRTRIQPTAGKFGINFLMLHLDVLTL